MRDDSSKRRRQERERIDRDQEQEFRYWAEKFGVSPDELREVIGAVGPIANAAERRLCPH